MAALILGLGLSVSCGSVTAAARSLERNGDLAEAVSLYVEALKQDPEDIQTLDALAADLMLLGRYSEALPVQERVVALDPSDSLTRVDLGFNYLNHQNRPGDAVRVFSEAASIVNSGKVFTFLAQAQEANRDDTGAEASLRRAIAVDPQYARSYQLLREFLVKRGRSRDAALVEKMASERGVTLELSQ